MSARGMAARLIGPLGLLLVGLAGAGALLLPVASALGAYVPNGSFGSPGAGDGQLNLVAPNLPAPPRTAGSGIAVNETSHDVYVADTGNHRVLQFSSTGSFIRAFGADVGGPGIDVCTVGCVAGTSESSPGAFQTPTFVAVDNSASPSNGDVYVVDSATNVVSKFEADGTLIASWGSGGQLDGSTATEGPFGEIGGIAVDTAGTLDVFRFEPEPGQIFQFDEDGTFSATLEVLSGSSPGGLGVDPSGNFFKTNGTPRVQKLDPSGADTVPPYGRVSASESSAGLAVYRSTGELFVVLTNGSINRYEFGPLGEVILPEGSCTPAPAPFEGCPPTETISEDVLGVGGGLATDSTLKTVYAADPGVDSVFAFTSVTTPTPITEAASGLGTEEATLNGSVNPNGVPLTACFFEYDTTEYEKDEAPHGEIAPCEDPNATEVGAGTSPVPVHADISDLDPGTVYHYRLVAANASDQAEGEDEEFASLGPIVSPASVSQITGTGARAGGTINPNGEATSFVVEYLTEAQFIEGGGYAEAQSAPAVPRELGSGTEAVEVFQQLSGLVPNTTYHLRLAASNGSASVVGEDRTFTTFAAPTVLPDGRAYELVSPPQKTGEVFAPEPFSSLGGSCSQCLPGFNNTMMPMQAAPDGEAVLYVGQPFSGGIAAGPNQYLSNRSASGWETQSLSGPLFGTAGGQGYTATSTDLGRGVYHQTEAALSPEAPSLGGKAYANLYLREEGGQMRPLVTAEPPNRIPGSVGETVGEGFRIFYAGANAGTALAPPLGHVIFEANDALTEAVPGTAPTAPEVEAAGECSFAGTECDLYEWFDGELRLINVLPGNATASTSAVIGSGRLFLNSPFVAPNVEQAISDDGRRIFWSEEGSGQVFVRVDGKETLEVPGPGKCKESLALAQRVCFLTASADGTTVLLSDGQLYELNGTETAYEEGPDLAGGLGGFEGILGASEDLSRIYFIDTAVLSGEENENEEEAEAGKLNLYAWSGGMPEFIGKLVANDNSLGTFNRYGAWRSSRPHRTAQVSPDGRFLAFMSQAQLTGYDNSGGPGRCGNEPCYEVFEYAADAESLSCASCNPNGQPPLGRSNLSLIVSAAPRFPPFRQPGNLSEEGEGRLFFESADALASRDTNGKVVDVYQWVPDEVGGCKEAGGCVSLISSGHSGNDSMFLDSSPSGKDAFFVTRERLLPPDQNSQLDLYVARAPHTPGEVVGFPEGGSAAPCGGEACKGGASSPPPGQDIGSAALTGPGNLTRPRPSRCARGKVRVVRRGKARCVARQRPRKHRRADSKRRTAHSNLGTAR
jgi:hypothetical protein